MNEYSLFITCIFRKTDFNWFDFFLNSNLYLKGNTPLHTAVHTTHTEIAKYLVASGADERKRNTSGLTPFQLAG